MVGAMTGRVLAASGRSPAANAVVAPPCTCSKASIHSASKSGSAPSTAGVDHSSSAPAAREHGEQARVSARTGRSASAGRRRCSSTSTSSRAADRDRLAIRFQHRDAIAQLDSAGLNKVFMPASVHAVVSIGDHHAPASAGWRTLVARHQPLVAHQLVKKRAYSRC